MRFLLSLVVLLTVMSSHADLGLSCVEIFSRQTRWGSPSDTRNWPSQTQALLAENKPQEAAWLLQKMGLSKEAAQLTNEILADLGLAKTLKYDLSQWPIHLGNEAPEKNADPEFLYNIHTSYLIEVGRVRAVLKFGNDNSVTEALAFQIGQFLQLKVPATIFVTIGGHEASLQYYVADRPMATQVGDVPFNYQIEFFDMLLMNADRNGDNFLVDQPFSPQAPHSFYESADQILIDNEKIFLFNPLLWQPNALELAHFITQQLENLKYENPELARLLANPKTEAKIVSLIKASALSTKDEAIQHVQMMLGIYQKIYSQKPTR